MEPVSALKSELKATILGILIWIPIGIFVWPVYLVLFIYHWIIHKIASKQRPDLIPLTKNDCFLVPKPLSYNYTSQVWKVRGDIDAPSFRQHFYKCFLSSEEDRVKYVNLYCYFIQYFGYIFKKKVKAIDLEYHIRELQLDEGTSVWEFVGKWMVTHDLDEFGKERPIWMVKIIRGLKDSDGITTTVVFKLHHGICDGYTMVHIVGKLSGEHAPYLFKEPMPPVLKMVKSMVQFPYLASLLWMDMRRCLKKSLTLTPPGDEDWLISFCTLDLKTVKEVRRVTRTHFVSVLISVQVGALKRLWSEFNPGKELEVEDLYIGHSMGWPQHPVMTNGGGMCNHLTLNVIKASMKIEDPLERLLDLDRNFHKTKKKGYPILAHSVPMPLCEIGIVPLNQRVIDMKWSILGVETALSALMCSSKPHSLMGRPVQNLYLPVIPISAFPNNKLMTVPVSHSGQLDISVNASTSLARSQDGLDRLTKVHFVEELECLRKRCQNLVE